MEVINVPAGTIVPPRIPCESDAKYVKHVICENARFHVMSWSSNGTHCSEPDCIINKPVRVPEPPYKSTAHERWAGGPT